MGIEKVYKEDGVKASDVKYPYVGEYSERGIVFYVLFTQPEVGIVVEDAEDLHGVGTHRTDWSEKLHFEPVDYTITFNKK